MTTATASGIEGRPTAAPETGAVLVPEIKVIKRKSPEGDLYYFIQGDIELQIFAPSDDLHTNSLLKSIDAIDKLPAGRWGELAIQNQLPCDPLDRKLLRPVFMGIIQLAWYRAFEGEPKPDLIDNQASRVEAYKRDLEHVRLIGSQPVDRAGKARQPRDPNQPSKPAQGARAVRLTEGAAESWSSFVGQKGVIVAAMCAAHACGPEGLGITKDQLAIACRGKLNTRQPEERVISFYFADWLKNKVIEITPEGTRIADLPESGWEAHIQTKDTVAQQRRDAQPVKTEAEPVKAEAEAEPKPAKKPAKKAAANAKAK